MNRKKHYTLPSFSDLPKAADALTEEEFLADPFPYMKLTTRTKNPSKDTEATYRSHLGQFLTWCKELDCSPFILTKEQLSYFRDWLLNCGLKPATVALKLTVIRHFYTTAISYGFTSSNPALRLAIKSPTEKAPPKKSLTAEEVSHLFSVFPDEDSTRVLRDKLLLSFMVLEGLRIVELHKMNENDINASLRSIRIDRQTIYPRNDTFTLLSRYLATKEVRLPDKNGLIPVFTVLGNNNHGNRMSRQSIRDAISDTLDKAGLKQQGITCHTLRHTCGTLLFQATGNLDLVQQTMRHKDKQLLATYQTPPSDTPSRHTTLLPIDILSKNKKDASHQK